MGVETAMAVAGTVASVGQAIAGKRQADKADAAAESAASSMRSTITQGMTNQFSGLQAATGAYDIADQQTQQAVAQSVEASREAGAEGVIGGVGKIVDAASEAGLRSAAGRGQAEMDVEKLKAAEQAKIDQMKYQGLLGLDQMRMEGAQAAAAQGRENMMAGIGGAFAGLGNIATGYQMDQGLYPQAKEEKGDDQSLMGAWINSGMFPYKQN